jgi:protein ImuB
MNGHDTAHGRVENMAGPYIVSGGWWNRELHREYHYASTENGEILWVYYDRQRRRWFLAGRVE